MADLLSKISLNNFVILHIPFYSDMCMEDAPEETSDHVRS